MLNQTATVIPIAQSGQNFQNFPYLDQQGIENYQNILAFSQLLFPSQITFRNVKISPDQHVHQIHIKGQSHFPHLVFLHGFGGTPMTAGKMFKKLSQNFQIHSLDIYGFGHSSRGSFSKDYSFQQMIQYYIKSIQKWRQSLQIQRFYFIGHSFEGYIAAAYAFAHPDRIINLFLVSPAAASNFYYFHQKQEDSCVKKTIIKIARAVYSLKATPSKLAQGCLTGRKFISHMTDDFGLCSKKKPHIEYYYWNLHSKSENSELGFYQLFEFPIKAKTRIVDMIMDKPQKFQISFYFGETDWMPRSDVDDLIKDDYKGVDVITVPKAGHSITLDNPQFLTKSILQKAKVAVVQILDISNQISSQKIRQKKTKKAKK